jgi:gamma-glutamyl hercynylcysteine S-oxide synthase
MVAPVPDVDNPDLWQAGPDPLSLAFMSARNRTLGLLAAFEAMAPDTDVGEALWLAGHAGWFAEAWINRNPQRGRGRACDPRPPRTASIEVRADRWWEPLTDTRGFTGRGEDRPDFTLTREYLRDTLDTTLDLLQQAAPDATGLHLFRLALAQEDLVGEAMVAVAQATGVPLPLAPGDPSRPREPLRMPAARATIGQFADRCVFDNEVGAHDEALPEFEIDAQAVTWAQFVEFVDDGGYDRSELWSSEGWDWLADVSMREGRRGPRYVEQIGAAHRGGAVLQTRFGRTLRMASQHAATHLSWWEADAWCRWAGRRLPFEAEWEHAARTAARRGFRWGEVTEWTADRFRAYPGFVPDPWTGRSSAVFGGEHRVRRGASWATSPRLVYPSFRGFGRPGDDQAFVGFRSCAD